MKVLSIILGILLTIFGISVCVTPLSTYACMGLVVGIVLFVYGVLGIINAIMIKKFGAKGVFAILSILLGLFVASNYFLQFMFETVFIYVVAAWFVVQGIITFVNAFDVKKYGGNLWIALLLLSILEVVLGILSFIQPIVVAMTIGIMAGVYIIGVGVNLITTANEFDK